MCGGLCFRVWLTVGGAEDSEDFKVQRHKSRMKGKKKKQSLDCNLKNSLRGEPDGAGK